jgi:drug/metabolite transporter (DMT)-like permease
METIMQTHTKALYGLIATACLWSVGGLFIKIVPWHPLAIAGLRSLIAGLVLLGVRDRQPFSFSSGVLLGGLANAGTMLFFVSATKMTTAANAILLQYTAPIFVAIFSFWFLRERIRIVDWITIGVVFCGLWLFFLDKLNTDGMLGNLLAILSGVCFGWQALFLRKYKDTSPVDMLVLGNFVTTLVGIPYLLHTPFTGTSIGIVFFLGTFQVGLPYFLYTFSIKHVPAIAAITILMLEPILNPMWVFMFLGEKPGFWATIGSVVVLGAIILRSFTLARKEEV